MNVTLTNEQKKRLLAELAQLDNDDIEPLSDEEVRAIEAEFQPVKISEEMNERLLKHVEMLRQEWFES